MSIAVSVIALATLGSGIALLLIRHRGQTPPVRPLQESPGEDESLELVPHITLNPSFNIDMLEHIAPDFNENRYLWHLKSTSKNYLNFFQ